MSPRAGIPGASFPLLALGSCGLGEADLVAGWRDRVSVGGVFWRVAVRSANLASGRCDEHWESWEKQRVYTQFSYTD